MKKFLQPLAATIALIAVLFLASGLRAQITIPNTFVGGTNISSSQVNTNFSTLGNAAFNRLTGGTITGDVTLSGAPVGLTVNGNVIVNSAGKIPALSSTYFASLSGANLTALNASQLTTGSIDPARGPFDTVITVSTTGTVNDWAPGLAGRTLIKFTGASDLIVTGFAGGVQGQRVGIRHIAGSAGHVFLANGSTGSSAGNRLTNAVGSSTIYTPIGNDGYAEYIYDGGSWLLVAHEQGGWLTATYNGANFSGSGGWTVDAGDITTMAYKLRGKEVTVAWYFGTTTVVTGTTLNILNGAYGGFVAAKTMLNTAFYNDNAAGNAAGAAQTTAGDNKIQLLKAGGANWSNATNATSVYGQTTFEVQ